MIEEIVASLAETQKQREGFAELSSNLINGDGLIPLSEVKINKNGECSFLCDSSISLVPHWRAHGPAKMLLSSPEWWPNSSLRFQSTRSLVGRAPVRGVSFLEAVEKLLNTGEQKHWSTFWVEPVASTLSATLAIRLYTNDAGLVLEGWQWIEGAETHYFHAILSEDASTITHVDGALVTFENQDDALRTFWEGRKYKGINYEKYFRVDGIISFARGIELIRLFLPCDELVEEYFQTSSAL